MNVIAARGILLAPPTLLTRVRKKMAQATDQREMSQLDDRLLRDIGVTWADIEIRESLD